MPYKNYRQVISAVWNSTLEALNVALKAGTAIIGKVGIDQTTPGTTNGVQVNAALPAGTNVIGKVRHVSATGDELSNDNSDAIRVDNELQEKVRHPFGKGVLTTVGIQYSAEHTTNTDDYETVEEITFYNLPGHTLEEIEFGLTMAIKSSGATESVLWKWQASDNGTDWEDLIAQQTRAADASAYLDVTASGRFALTGNFLGTGTTFQIRAVIKSGGAGGETATGKAKNSSYIYAKYRRA